MIQKIASTEQLVKDLRESEKTLSCPPAVEFADAPADQPERPKTDRRAIKLALTAGVLTAWMLQMHNVCSKQPDVLHCENCGWQDRPAVMINWKGHTYCSWHCAGLKESPK